VSASLEESIATKRAVADSLLDEIATAAEWVTEAIRGGGKLMICGNGGSAADAQHLAAELVGRFERDGRALAAIALTTDTSIITAIGNDAGYERVFAAQVEALANQGDVLLALSTSGNSPNVNNAARAAAAKGARVIAMTGQSGGELGQLADLALRIPSTRTARIQESHITIGHIVCELVELELR
jgi:D-sedoheptulose 7-phosphate isomerase